MRKTMQHREKRLAIASLLILLTAAISFAQPADSATNKPAAEAKSNWLETTKAMAEPEKSKASEPAARGGKPWEIKFKAYAWLQSYHGTAVIAGAKSTLDVSCNDTLHAADEVNCMVPINLEARWGQWGMIVDLYHVRVKDSRRQGRISVDTEATQTILELAGFYRVGTWPISAGSESLLTFDIIAGARYQRLSGNIGLTGPRGNSVSIDGTQEWWDPFIGPRVTLRATDWLTLSLRGDIGGFDITNCSDCVVQIIGAAEVSITKHCFLELGYRILDTDYSGSGGRFTYDVTMHGPYLAFGVKF
jgi:hypothetical protein